MNVPEFQTIRLAVEGPLGRIILNRPDRLNALGATMMREIAAAARFFDERIGVRVVILSGAGRAFCAGADLLRSPMAGASQSSVDSQSMLREFGRLGMRMADAVEEMRAVTIAQVHGYAVGGGVVLAAACDLRVAAKDAVFSIPEIKLGIPLAWGGIPRLVREIGPALTKELVMTCRRFTPTEAKAAGFLNRVVPIGRLAAEARSLAGELLEMPSVALTITKEHVNSIARAMGTGSTAFADGDVLISAALDPESLTAGRKYFPKTVGRKKKPRG